MAIFQEFGIFDALEKQYLRSFIFGIYLVSGNAILNLGLLNPLLFKDPNDPNK